MLNRFFSLLVLSCFEPPESWLHCETMAPGSWFGFPVMGIFCESHVFVLWLLLQLQNRFTRLFLVDLVFVTCSCPGLSLGAEFVDPF